MNSEHSVWDFLVFVSALLLIPCLLFPLAALAVFTTILNILLKNIVLSPESEEDTTDGIYCSKPRNNENEAPDHLKPPL